MCGIGDVDNGRAVRLVLAGLRIDGRRDIVGSTVMSDIGDPAIALVVDRRLIGAARLQIVGADKLHIGGFGRRANHLLLSLRAGEARNESHRGKRDK